MKSNGLDEIENGEKEKEGVVRNFDFGQLVTTFVCFETPLSFHSTYVNNLQTNYLDLRKLLISKRIYS